MNKNKWLSSLLLIVLAGSLIVGCDNNVTQEKPKQVPAASQEKEEKTDTEQKTYAVGEEINLKNRVLLTITNVEKSLGTETSTKPMNGREYIIVSVKLDNIGKDDFDYASYHFGLIDKRNKTIEQDNLTTVDVDTYLHHGTLKDGESITGTITFQRPIGEQGLKLFFQPVEASLPKTIINLP